VRLRTSSGTGVGSKCPRTLRREKMASKEGVEEGVVWASQACGVQARTLGVACAAALVFMAVP
jgi:hypothetical protein